MPSQFGPGYLNRYAISTPRGSNPYEGFTRALGSQNWAGSSGYWGGLPIPGQNPGDRERIAMARRYGVPVPSGVNIPADVTAGFPPGIGVGMPGQRPLNPEEFLGRYELPSRNPALSAQAGNTIADAASADKSLGLPHFDDLKKTFAAGSGDVQNWYNRYQAGNDITGFAATQRAADDEAAKLTGQYADTARGILGDAKGITDRYRTEGEGALDKVLTNAQEFYNKDIPASIADAQARAVNYTSRYGMARGGGLGSDIGRIAGQSAVQAALPFQREGRGFIDSALRTYAPFYGDVASRDYNRVAGLNLPTEGNIYGAQVGDVMRGKATEQQIQSLDMLVRERGLNAAIENLKRQGLPDALVNDLVSQWQRLKSGNLQLAGQASGLEQQYGAERGYYDRYGAPVAQPEYPGLPRPNFPNPFPNRYTPNDYTPPGGGYPQEIGGAPLQPGGGTTQGFDRYGNPTGSNFDGLPQWVKDQRTLRGQPGRYANEGWQG
jgi:hypothetical protein